MEGHNLLSRYRGYFPAICRLCFKFFIFIREQLLTKSIREPSVKLGFSDKNSFVLMMIVLFSPNLRVSPLSEVGTKSSLIEPNILFESYEFWRRV